MTLSFYEQLVLIIYFTFFGMFLIISYDVLFFYFDKCKLKVYLRHIIESLYWVIMIIISCFFMLRTSKGYLPLYTFLFYLTGIIIYLAFFKKSFLNDYSLFDKVISKIITKLFKFIKYIFFPKEVYLVIKKIMKKIFFKVKKQFSRFIKIFKAKDQNNEV